MKKNATRSDLIRLGAEKVRSEPSLFSSFKTFLEEDAAHIYPNGQIPKGCFSCTFPSTFEKWKRYVIKSGQYKSNKIVMSNKQSTYELADKNTRVYFKGVVLDRNSSDEAWNEWINYPTEDIKIEKRKANFSKLPSSKADQKKENSDKEKENDTSSKVEPTKEASNENSSSNEQKESSKEEVPAKEPAAKENTEKPKSTRKTGVKAGNTIKKTRRTSNS